MACFQKISSILKPCLLNQGKNVVCLSSQAKDWIPKTEPTHTDQNWDVDDYRNARFVDRPKHVNKNFAIKLVEQVPPKKCSERVVWCDGGSGATGHPRVFINLDKPGNHSCGYCGLRYYRDAHAH